MKTLIALAFTLASASAFAHRSDRGVGPTAVHIYSQGMSCAAVQDAVNANGAVILHYGSGLFERVVAHDGYCSQPNGEETQPIWVPAADTGRCMAGYTCEARRNEG